jgi:Peptidase family M28
LKSTFAVSFRTTKKEIQMKKIRVRPISVVAQVIALSLASVAATSMAQPPTLPSPPPIEKMLSEISAKRIEANIRTLVGFGTRSTLSDTVSDTRGIGAARRWIKNTLDTCNKANGNRMTVAFDTHLAPVSPRIAKPTEVVNIVATLPGAQAQSTNRLYVVSGHYDSMPTLPTDSTTDAPGANDDASGTAAVIELACVMSKYEFDATIIFMAVAGEEQGLIGARFWAQAANARGANIAGMITNDIIGNTKGADGTIERNRVRLFAAGVPAQKDLPDAVIALLRTGGENDLPTRQLARHIKSSAEKYLTDMKVDIIYRRDRYLRGGDHLPFLDLGYAAVRLTEPNENWQHQHQNPRIENGKQYGDLPEYVDFDYVAKVARVNAAALASLALAPASPSSVQMETLQLENNTTLRWAANTEPDIAGYRIVWRDTTAPFWQHQKDVGNVTRATIVGVSKDNAIFGVVAVDKAGFASPAVYPVPFSLR